MAQKSKLMKFPPELRKKWASSLYQEWRFFLIVLIVLLLQIGSIIYLKDHLPIVATESVSRLQSQYASQLLDQEQIIEPVPYTTAAVPSAAPPVLEGGGRAGVPAAGGTIAGGPAGGAPGAGPGGPYAEAAGAAESRLPTMGEMAARGRAGAGGRSTSMADVANEVGNVGFLGILTAGSGYVPAEYISGITSYGDAENARLGSVLSSLNGLAIGNGPGGGGGWGEGPEFFDPTAYRGPTGTRREARALSVDELLNAVQPRGTVAFKGVQRTEQSYEDLSIELPTRPPIPITEEEKERLRRKPEFVQTIINKHRLAITDCYKRLLRTNPSLKGKVEVRFAIDPDGHVTWVELISSTIDNESLKSCIMARIRNWNDFGYGDPTAPDEIYRQVFTFGY